MGDNESAESFVQLPQAGAGGPLSRQLQFVIAQPNGTFQTVMVEGAWLADPSTSRPYVTISREQADTLIEQQEKTNALLQAILVKLGD